jgi:ABC-type phosphate/phosphonate transport system ATPase subunit
VIEEVAQLCDACHIAAASPAVQGLIQRREAMTNNVKAPAEGNDAASVTLIELSEAELSAVLGGSGAGKVTFNPFVISKLVDKSSPHLFL